MPWLPAVSKGAIALIEQFLCAYSQEATRHAVSVRVGVTDAKRLNGRFLKMGYDQADQDIFGAAMPAPRNVIVCKPDSKTKKGEKKEDGDFQAPPEAE